MNSRILVVDDELSMREFMSILLEREGCLVEEAPDVSSALKLLETSEFDLVISDVQMPGQSGVELLEHIKQNRPDTAVLLITAFSTPEQAVQAMKLGAIDYLSKPFKVEELKLLVKNAIEKRDLRRENRQLKARVATVEGYSGIIGGSRRIREVFDLLQKLAGSQATVLITGESGTGKELAARAIHTGSSRNNKPFVAVNCGAIPESLIESELFGHTKGAFTGSVADRAGLFEQANGGSLFLDEIGELPLTMQTRLLRVIQEREVRRVGGTTSKKIDVRLIAATNRDLAQQVKEGSFREDLYYRINVLQVVMPPLRERVEDIPQLIQHLAEKHGSKNLVISGDAMKALMAYDFPGNVRELENIVERALVLDQNCITMESLPHQMLGNARQLDLSSTVEFPDDGINLEDSLGQLEQQYLLRALEKAGGNKTLAAELLGMTFRSYRYKLSKYGLAGDGD